MKQLKILICGIGFACLLSNSFILFYTFIAAYFNNNQIVVTINEIGEANFELVFLPISIILGLYAILTIFKFVPKPKKV